QPDPNLAVFGDDVRHVAALQDRVVHAGARVDVLAHHVHGVREELQAVDGAAAVPRIERGVRGAAVELDGDVDDGLRALRVGARLVVGVPGEHDVDAVHHALAQHVELPADGLL